MQGHSDMPADNAPGPGEDASLPALRDDSAADALPAELQRCQYCGAMLSPQLYFCGRCATPYKDIETVLTPAAELQLTDGMRIARMAPQVATLFWAYFAVVVSVGILAYALFTARDMHHIAYTIQSVAIFGTSCVFAVLHWPSLVTQFKRIGFLSGYAWLGLLILVPLLAINLGYHTFLIELGAESVTPGLRELLSRPARVLLICIFPAISEEIAMRGLLQHWLQVAIRPAKAMVLASALFAMLHFTVLSFPYLFGVGMLLGWVKWKTGSLYPSMLIHFLHNLIVVEFFPFA